MVFNMSKTLQTITILVLLIAGPNKGFSQQNTEVLQGQIVEDSTGEPVPGATVYIDELGRGTAAESDGYFEFQDIPNGSYTLIVRALVSGN